MPETTVTAAMPRLVAGERPVRVAHLTTVDMSLALLLEVELQADVSSGVETFGLSAPGRFVPRVEALGVRHVSLPSLTRSWDLSADVRAFRELLAAVRELRPDVLHTHNPKTGVMGRLVGRLAGVPVVVNTCHGLWASPDDSLAKRLIVYAAEAVAAAVSDAELYQNALDRRTMSRLVRQSKARVVGNGTDLQSFRPDEAGRSRVRAELGVSPDELLVGSVGRLVAEKGIAEFIATARELYGLARFVWVGPGDPEKSDAYSGGVEPVGFLGERSDMPAVYNALDVFVLPSYREGFSRSAMEAAACETAMVLSDIRGCREIGNDEQEVLLAPPRDPRALCAQVARLLTDDALRERLAGAARRRALDAFDQRRVAQVSLDTYASVAARKGLGWAVGAAVPG